MKLKMIAVMAFMAIGTMTYAQQGSGFGIKGGVNYAGNGKYFESIGDNAKSPDRNVGYHLGVFAKFGESLYFRPEIVYTQTKSDYGRADLKIQKLDVPLLVGIDVIGPLSVFAGPSMQYIVDSEFDNVTLKDLKDDFTIGFNFGIAASFDKLGIDLRYERGFSKNEATFINDNIGVGTASRIDTRPDQLILSLSYDLF